jgi:type IX secretion system PorP/SprF family membrane protein
MKKLFLHSALILFSIVGFGQLHSLSNQYVLNGLAINPGYAGSDEALSTTLMYRNQWTGFEGAPKTITAAIHSPLRNELIGLGLLVVNDQIGVNSETSIIGNYAYMIEMGDAKLSFGVGIGVTFLNVAWDQLDVTDMDDIGLNNAAVNITNPNFSAGMYYYNKDFFLGLSAPMFLSYKYLGENSDQLELKNDISEYNIYLTSGYVFEINRRLKFFPSGLIKMHPDEVVQADVSGQFIMRDRLWLGLTYRTVDAIAALLQLQVTDQFRVAYSYDMGVSKTIRSYGGSHEVMLKYVLNHNSRVVGPHRF